MITYLTALIATLTTAPFCPPESGQLRWDVRHEFTAERTYAARGAIWDRDQSGAPSKGDVFRIEAGWLDGQALPLEELWLVLGEGLATDLAATVTAAREVKVMCESTLAIKQEPTVMATAVQLARALDAAAKPAQAEAFEHTRMAEAMGKWAQEICKKTKYIAVPDLTEALVVKAVKPFGALGETSVRAAADLAARDRSLACTRLSQGTISFD
jgi:hypothetical protein